SNSANNSIERRRQLCSSGSHVQSVTTISRPCPFMREELGVPCHLMSTSVLVWIATTNMSCAAIVAFWMGEREPARSDGSSSWRILSLKRIYLIVDSLRRQPAHF